MSQRRRAARQTSSELPSAPHLPPNRSVGHLLRDANRTFQKRLAVRIAPLGVPLGQWYVLRVLWQEDGLSQAEIAQRAGISTPTAMMALQALHRAHHVRRSPDPEDRRKNVVRLTPSGRALEAPCLTQAIEINAIATHGLSRSDIDTLIRLLQAATANLSEHDVQVSDQEIMADEGS